VVAEKIDWLKEYLVPTFGTWIADTAIFDRDKSSYDAFAMIDDRPTLRNSGEARWQHIVFSQSYNKSVETDFRLEGWYDNHLEDLLARARAGYLA
jgi:5'(3')-deoxyribonucleotidase